MKEKRPLLIPACVIAAALTANIAGIKISGLLAAALIPLATLSLLLLKKKEVRRNVFAALCGLLAGLILFIAEYFIFYAPTESYVGQEHEFSGRVISSGVSDSEWQPADIRVFEVDGQRVMPFKMRVYFEAEEAPLPGDSVKASGKALGADGVQFFGYERSKGIYLKLFSREYTAEKSSGPAPLAYYTWLIRQKIDAALSRYLQGGAYAKALGILLGDKSGMSDAERLLYSQTGVSHAFAVSGMHISFLALFINILLKLFKIPRKPRALITAVAVLFFIALVDFTPSAVRAGIMFLFLLVGVLIEREESALVSLMNAGALICVTGPFAVTDVGFQLSFLAVLGLVTCGKAARASLINLFEALRFKGSIAKSAAGILSASAVATLFTMPVTAMVFGRVSLISPLVNAAILWAVGIIFTAAVLLACFSFLPPMAGALAFIIEGLSGYADRVLRWSVSLPPARLSLQVTILVIAFILAGAGLGAFFKKKGARPGALALAVLIVLLAAVSTLSFTYVPREGELLFAAVDVGQGDALVFIKNREAVIVDCGSADKRAAEAVSEYLRQKKITALSAIIVTHMHDDHANGVSALIETFGVQTVYLPRGSGQDRFGEEIIKAAEEAGGDAVILENNLACEPLSEVMFYIYTDHMDGYTFTDEEKYNNTSLVVLADFGESEILVTGDIEALSEKRLLASGVNIDADILKIAHHGSSSSSTVEFMIAVSPSAAVVSYGENKYGLPHKATIERITRAVAALYSTYENSTVEFATLGDGVYNIIYGRR